MRNIFKKLSLLVIAAAIGFSLAASSAHAISASVPVGGTGASTFTSGLIKSPGGIGALTTAVPGTDYPGLASTNIWSGASNLFQNLLTALNLNNVQTVPTDFATNGCAGDPTATDFSSCVHAIYAAAHTAGLLGVKIVVTKPVAAANFTSPLAFDINGMVPSLVCLPGVTLQYGGSGTDRAITFNFGNPVGHGVSEDYGCSQMGTTSLVVAGQANTRTTVGIYMGGTNGAVGVDLHDWSINGFGTDLQIGANSYMGTFHAVALSGGNGGQSTQGALIHINAASNSGERNVFDGITLTDPGNSTATNCVYITNGATASNFFDNVSSDDCSVRIGASDSIQTFDKWHVENSDYADYGSYSPFVGVSSDTSTLISASNIGVENDTSGAKSFDTIFKVGGPINVQSIQINNYAGGTIPAIVDHSIDNGVSHDHVCQVQVQGGTLTNIIAGSGGVAWSRAVGGGCVDNTDNSYSIGMVAQASNVNKFFSGSVTTATFDHSANWVWGISGSTYAMTGLSSNGIVTTSGGTGALSVTATTGSGNVVLATAPTITGATITTTSVNGVTLTTGGGTSTFLNANGAYSTPGGGSGTVTSVSVVTNQGVSGSVATATTTPAITLSLGALTGVTSFNGLVVTANTGVITTGTWNGTAIANANLANSTISGVSLGSTLFGLSATNSTLTFSGSYTGAAAQTVGLNLGNANTWTALQTFGTNISIGGVTATGATGTGNIVFATSPTLTGASLGSTSIATTQSPFDNSTKLATTAYVDAAQAALASKPDVAYASTSALPANTYANGSSGVGATLTGNANGPLIVDSVTILVGQVGQRILVAGEATSANNGWYTITQQGVVAVSPYILKRAVESDQAAEIGSGYLTAVVAPNTVTPGTSNNGKLFISVAAADPFVVGTTNLTFSQVGSAYSAGTGLTLSGSSFSVNSSQSIATLSNLISNGTVETGGGIGTLSVIANTGTGNNVLATSPTLVTPTLGAATATSINSMTFSGAFGLTLAGNFTTAGAFNQTLTATATTNATLPAGTTNLATIVPQIIGATQNRMLLGGYSNGQAATNGTVASGVLYSLPFMINKTVTVAQMSSDIETNVVGNAEMGIYADNGNGLPGALVLDAGNFSTNSLGTRNITGLSTVLTPGQYWVAIVYSATPGVKEYPNNGLIPTLGSGTTINAASSNFGMVTMSQAYGALPSNFSTTPTYASSAPFPIVGMLIQ